LKYRRIQKTYPVFTTRLPDTRFAFAALALAVTGDIVTDSAEVPGAMAGREIRTVTSGQGQAEERGDQEHIFHFAGLRELVKVFSNVEKKE
jgi:hypothetical protein